MDPIGPSSSLDPIGPSSSPNPNLPSGEGRNWAEISPDVLSVIFGKVGAVDTLLGAGRVCRAWHRVAREPLLWRRVVMTRLDHLDEAERRVVMTRRDHLDEAERRVVMTRRDHLDEAEMEAMARLAVDWSAGRMEEFSAAFFGSDELLLYIAERANLLKSLHLISCYNISDEGLTEMVERLPCLEKLEIIFGSFGMKLCESVGQACPQLKVFKLNTKRSYFISDNEEELDDTNNCDALGVAKTMHELRELQLFGNKVTNEGLKAILDSCPHLESLDVRRCFNLNMDASMKAMCSRIRNLRLPVDSADDYAYDAFDGFFGRNDPLFSDNDNDNDNDNEMMYDMMHNWHGFGDDMMYDMMNNRMIYDMMNYRLCFGDDNGYNSDYSY